MALHKSFTMSGPSVITTGVGPIECGMHSVSLDCYIRVTSVSCTKSKAVAFVHYFNSDDAERVAPRLGRDVEFRIDLDGPNPIAQAYLHLKSLPEFAGATDC